MGSSTYQDMTLLAKLVHAAGEISGDRWNEAVLNFDRSQVHRHMHACMYTNDMVHHRRLSNVEL